MKTDIESVRRSAEREAYDKDEIDDLLSDLEDEIGDLEDEIGALESELEDVRERLAAVDPSA